MILKIINKSNNPLPRYESAQAAGMDIRCNITEAITLQPMERRLIPTGLFIELPVGYEAQIRPRSGLALKRGLTVLNTPGTIDADYRGEVGVILANLSGEAQTIEPGEIIYFFSFLFGSFSIFLIKISFFITKFYFIHINFTIRINFIKTNNF